jgi:hypothetical protein
MLYLLLFSLYLYLNKETIKIEKKDEARIYN